MTGDPNCKVRVSLTNSIQLTSRFSMDINDFFNKDGQTQFINRMAALLQITDYSRIKIVGVYSGSVIITTYIDAEPVPIDKSTSADHTESATALVTLQNKLEKMIKSGAVGTAFAGSGFGNLQSINTNLIKVDPDVVE